MQKHHSHFQEEYIEKFCLISLFGYDIGLIRISTLYGGVIRKNFGVKRSLPISMTIFSTFLQSKIQQVYSLIPDSISLNSPHSTPG
jgi:hypothetical protein